MFVLIMCNKGNIMDGTVTRWYDTYEEAANVAKTVAKQYPTKVVGIYSWVNNISG